MNQYFYHIARQKYIIVKKYLKTITKTQAVEEETATIENEIDCKYTKENDDDDLVKIFKDLDPNKRWRLSTGKYVENELFIFGL